MIENRREVLSRFIAPFVAQKRSCAVVIPCGWVGVRKIKVSSGMVESGYDITLGEDVVLYQGHAVLGVSAEHVNMPSNMAARLIGKSTWARLGVHLNVTEIDPGFRGWVTLEITYMPLWEGWLRHLAGIVWPRRLRIPAGTGIGCLQFVYTSTPAEYRGKYDQQPARPVEAA